MNKYLNIIIVAFFSILTISSKMGLALCLPIILIYSIVNNKSLIIFIPVSLISIYFFKNEYFISIIIMFMLVTLYLLFIKKLNNLFIDFLIIFLINFILILLIRKNIILDDLMEISIYCLICSLIFISLKSLINLNQSNFKYFELIAIIISILGSSYIGSIQSLNNLNITFILTCFYAMYFSYNLNYLFSFFFSILMSLFLFYILKIDYSLIVIFISIFYFIGNILSSFILVTTCSLISLFYPQYFSVALTLGIICIVFELVKKTIINEKIKKKEMIHDIDKKKVDILNKEILAFSSFLDSCVSSVNNNEYNSQQNKKVDEGIRNLEENYCKRCYMNKKCRNENLNIYHDLQQLIIDCQKENFNFDNIRSLSVCPYNIELRKSAIIINNKISFKNDISKNRVINNTLNGISNILRQYTIENNLKKEIKSEEIFKIKQTINDSGYYVSYFEIIRMDEKDFLFEIGIRGFCYKDLKDNIEKIINDCFIYPVSIDFSHNDKEKTYIYIFPKIKNKIEYSSSNIASGNISGDNILVNDNKLDKTLAVICDGMGKGYKANKTSNIIIDLIEKLNESSISSYTSIQILNTFCSIKNEYDNFTTLDFLEIDKKEGTACFYKMAAAPSYIFHESKHIDKIENKLLPLGNENNVEYKVVNIEKGDIIIMSSDGIFDNLPNEDELQTFITSIIHMSVEKIVYQIINYIKTSTRITDDDISLIVLRVDDNKI